MFLGKGDVRGPKVIGVLEGNEVKLKNSVLARLCHAS
jgi:hypothetical protein